MAAVAVNIFIPFMLVSLFFPDIYHWTPFVCNVCVRETRGSHFSSCFNGYRFQKRYVIIKLCRFLPRHCDAVIRSRRSSSIQFEESSFSDSVKEKKIPQ